jgi:hypothetical protein
MGRMFNNMQSNYNNSEKFNKTFNKTIRTIRRINQLLLTSRDEKKLYQGIASAIIKI